MSLITDTLEIFRGRLRLHLFVDGKSAVDVVITPGETIIEIKNPILALEMGLQHMGKKKGISSYILKAIKAAGYKVKVKYKLIEFEI